MTSKRNQGVTLIEVMVSLVLVSTVLLISLTASANLLRNEAQRETASDGSELLARFLDEVTSRDFVESEAPVFGPETNELGSDRSGLDDIDDYHGYVESPPTERDGSTIAAYEGWTVAITVRPASPTASGIVTGGGLEQPLRLIEIVCTAPDGSTSNGNAVVSDVPSDAGPNTSVERWRQLRLNLAGRELSLTAPLRNAPDVAN